MGTTAHGLPYPEDYNEKADVPTVLQEMAEAIEDALVTVDAEVLAATTAISNAIPVGLIAAYGGIDAPTNWRLCDGSAHGSAALATVLGSANTPDLRNRFVVSTGSKYARGATGGADTVKLTALESGVGVHKHPLTINDATPAITVKGGAGIATGEETGAEIDGGGTVYVTDGTGGGAGGAAITATQAAHDHTGSVGNNTGVAATNAHENRPPYYALTYIIYAGA